MPYTLCYPETDKEKSLRTNGIIKRMKERIGEPFQLQKTVQVQQHRGKQDLCIFKKIIESYGHHFEALKNIRTHSCLREHMCISRGNVM